ncbi:type IV pilin protein [uncultured Fibrobacter sp.]|uniref:type IV pilin protein n=1 Tax=uncultured Fibrobacter sp. TaxID=261512 RepID=UPI0035A671DA
MKKGFTLVEIMVVVAITGILAAVAVPKIFGQIVKAKAAEIPIASSNYIKLQEAFVGEGQKIGSWDAIGYTAPGGGKTEVFEYLGCVGASIPVSSAQDGIIGWRAANLEVLKNCAAGNSWTISIDPEENQVKYNNIVSSADCENLVAHWTVGEISDGACSATADMGVIDVPQNNETPVVSSSSSEEASGAGEYPESSASTESSNGTSSGGTSSAAKTSASSVVSSSSKNDLPPSQTFFSSNSSNVGGEHPAGGAGGPGGEFGGPGGGSGIPSGGGGGPSRQPPNPNGNKPNMAEPPPKHCGDGGVICNQKGEILPDSTIPKNVCIDYHENGAKAGECKTFIPKKDCFVFDKGIHKGKCVKTR